MRVQISQAIYPGLGGIHHGGIHSRTGIQGQRNKDDKGVEELSQNSIPIAYPKLGSTVNTPFITGMVSTPISGMK